MSVNPYDSPLTPSAPPPKSARTGFRLWELLVVVGVIGLLIAMLLPMRRSAGEAGRRMSCQNNLRQIGMALHNYHEEYGAFPPAYTVDASGRPLHSWRTLILPYCEQKSLYERIDLTKSWDDPVNQAARETNLSVYQCPSAKVAKGMATYLAVVGPSSCLQPTTGRKLAELTDKPAATLLVVETNAEQAVPWMSPQDATESQVVSFATAKALSHPGGMQALFADSHVQFLPASTKPDVLRAMISAAGGDDDVQQE